MSAQAVGGAVGHNPISILIPCHRVLGYNGNPTGYAGGIDKKMALLRIERATEHLILPTNVKLAAFAQAQRDQCGFIQPAL